MIRYKGGKKANMKGEEVFGFPISACARFGSDATYANHRGRNEIDRNEFRLFVRYILLASVYGLDNIMRRFPIDGASYRLCCAEDFLDGAREFFGEGFGAEDSGDGDDFVEGDVARVFDVLLLFAVAWGLYSWLKFELEVEETG